ncbi:MAG TPA: prepilin-type N-terminal cleavage/methylation domain-containing protein [Gemmatales bacterium]|nr:prepilin-type N-terminal cleavage/methylation domain-containing protein [Gemmatales bacterium]
MRLIHVQKRDGLERKGFTLIELLVVITIIGILMALTLGVISKVYAYLDEVKVVSEVNKLAQGCEQFKSTFGRYPPSRIILCENTATYASIISGAILPPPASGLTNAQFQALAAFSTEYLSAIFPNINLNGASHNWDGSLAGVTPTIDAAGVYTILEGQHCLVYFLGGIRYNGSDPSGFNTDKTNPTAQTTGARLGSFFVFDAARLNTTAAFSSTTFPSYNDVYGTPYAYFAAKFPGTNNYPNAYVPTSLAMVNDCYNLTTTGTVNFVPYFSSSVPPTPPAGWAAAISFKFHKPDTYQVISAGKDKQFGTGGQFNQTDPEQSLFIPTSVLPAVTIDMLQANYDNITSVTNGRVVPK